jgi:hypothetical protein
LSFTAIAAASDFGGKPMPSWPGYDDTGMEARMARAGLRRARSFASDSGAFGEALQASESRGSPSHARTPSGSSIVSAGPASPFDDESVSHPHIVSEGDADSSFLEELASMSDHGHSKYHHRRRSQAKALPTPAHTPLRSSFYASDVDPASHVSEGSRLAVSSDAATPPPPKIPRLSLACYDGAADDVSTSAASLAPPRNGHQHLLPPPPPPSAAPLTPVTASGDVPEPDFGAQHSNAETSAVDAWLKQGRYSHGASPMRSTIPSTIPKLFRSATDAYEDELFAPDADASPPAMSSASAQHQHQQLQCSPNNNNPNLLMPDRRVLSERMHEANRARMLEARDASLQAAQPLSRGRSPFRQGSPHAPPPANSFDDSLSLGQYGSSQHANVDTLMLAASRAGEDTAAAATISPREALIDFHPDDASAFTPLFAPLHSPPAHSEGSSPESDVYEEQQQSPPQHASPAPASLAPPSAPFTFGAPLAGPNSNLQVPQQYPFIPRNALVSEHSINQLANATPQFPAQLISMESSMDQSEDHSSGHEHIPAHASPTPSSTPHAAAAAAPSSSIKQEFPRPDDTAADTGTFTCTYHGCTLRFETPAKLQRHKREAHRHAGHARHGSADSTGSGTGAGTPGVSMGMGMTSAAVAAATGNGQAGPHRCERINPATGRRCDTIFSRPYDLTRHEDTIHNARKIKARCQYCTTEEKTFSRRDALTRHMRLVHPEIEFGVRSRRNRLNH